nr:hypothetical protein [Actinoplanes solisilvae]
MVAVGVLKSYGKIWGLADQFGQQRGAGACSLGFGDDVQLPDDRNVAPQVDVAGAQRAGPVLGDQDRGGVQATFDGFG